MHPVLQEAGGFTLENVSPSEYAALSHIPSDADTTGSPEAKARLLPPGFTGETATPENNADWEEFVHPDLEDLFKGDLAHVAQDLQAATQEEDEYTIEISSENAERWFRALNQARLVMHTKHDFPDDDALSEEEHMASITALLQSGEFAPYLRSSRLYAVLQEWIVANCLKY